MDVNVSDLQPNAVAIYAILAIQAIVVAYMGVQEARARRLSSRQDELERRQQQVERKKPVPPNKA